MSELLVFEDAELKESEGQWPVEVLVTMGTGGGAGAGGQLMLLDRDSYKEIASEGLTDPAKGEGLPGEIVLQCQVWELTVVFVQPPRRLVWKTRGCVLCSASLPMQPACFS